MSKRPASEALPCVQTVPMQSDEASDFTIIIKHSDANHTHIACHKCNLAAHCKFFAALFSDSSVSEYELSDTLVSDPRRNYGETMIILVGCLYEYPANLIKRSDKYNLAFFANYYGCQYIMSGVELDLTNRCDANAYPDDFIEQGLQALQIAKQHKLHELQQTVEERMVC